MRWIVSRPFLAAGWLVLLLTGCQHGECARQCCPKATEGCSVTAPTTLPGGMTPASYCVRPATPVAPTPAAPQQAATVRASFVPAAPNYSLRPRPSLPVRPPATPPTYANASDYGWLVGCLQHEPEHNRWSIRFADPGHDVHDGVLQLFWSGSMERFRSGQPVRVEGELIDPAPYEIKPAYQVRSLQVLAR